MIVSKLRIGRGVSLFEFSVAGVKRSVIKIRIGFERALVSVDRLVHVAAYERGLAFTDRSFRGLDL